MTSSAAYHPLTFPTSRASLNVQRQLCAPLLFHPLRLLEGAELGRQPGASDIRADTSTWIGQAVTIDLMIML